jgi:hypothetical protein
VKGEAYHHVRDDLEPRILCQLETLTSRLHRVPSVGVSRDILVHRLNTDLRIAKGARVSLTGREPLRKKKKLTSSRVQPYRSIALFRGRINSSVTCCADGGNEDAHLR